MKIRENIGLASLVNTMNLPERVKNVTVKEIHNHQES